VRPYLEKPSQENRAGGVVQGEGPEFKPQYLPLHKPDFQSNFLWNNFFKTERGFFPLSYLPSAKMAKTHSRRRVQMSFGITCSMARGFGKVEANAEQHYEQEGDLGKEEGFFLLAVRIRTLINLN
jgi:hypothetical protein